MKLLISFLTFRKETNKATAGAPGRPNQPGLPALLDSSPPEQLAPSKKPIGGGTTKANSTGANSRSSTSNNHRLKPQQMASSLSGCVPRHSPLRASPSYPSPGHHRSPTGSSVASAHANQNRWLVHILKFKQMEGTCYFTKMGSFL